MKRLIIVAMVIFTLALPVFADITPGEWTNTGNISGEGNGASLKATFTINKESIADQVTIGFTSSELNDSFSVSQEVENILTNGVTLKDADGDGKATTEEQTINVFWQVTSANTIDVSLYLDEPMKKTDGSEYLGWNIYDAPVDSGTLGNPLISIATPEDNSSVSKSKVAKDLEIGHKPTEKPSVAGYKSIVIGTEDYRNKPTGTYEGYVYVEVSAESGGEV